MVVRGSVRQHSVQDLIRQNLAGEEKNGNVEGIPFRAGDPPQITPKFSYFFNNHCFNIYITVSNRLGASYGYYNY